MGGDAFKEELDGVKDSLADLTRHFTVLVDSHGETKNVLSSISESMATLVELQVKTQENTNNIGRLFDKYEDVNDKIGSIETSIYQSCATKSKEVEYSMDARHSARFSLVLWVIAGMFGLFIGAVVFFNAQDQDTLKELNQKHETTVENSTNIKVIIANQSTIMTKLDELKRGD